MIAVDQNLGRRSAGRRQRDEQILPHTPRRPSDEPVVECLARPIDRWSIDLAPARLHTMDDAADHPSVIDPGNAPHLMWQHRPQPLELLLTQPELAQVHAPVIAEPESQSGHRGNPVYGSRPWRSDMCHMVFDHGGRERRAVADRRASRLPLRSCSRQGGRITLLRRWIS